MKERHVPFLSTKHKTLGTRQIPFNGRDEISIHTKQCQIKNTHMPVSRGKMARKWMIFLPIWCFEMKF